jgi:hypothetical protein
MSCRDNWNFTRRTAGRSSNSSLNQLSFQVGRRKFDEPNNSTACRVLLERQHAADRRQHPGDQDDTGDIVELRDTFFTAHRQRALGHGREGRRRVAARARRLGFPRLPDRPDDLRHRRPALPLLYAYTSGSGAVRDHDEPHLGLRAGRLRPAPRLTLNSACATTSTPTGNNPDYTSPLHPRSPRARHQQLPAARRLLVGRRRHRTARRPRRRRAVHGPVPARAGAHRAAAERLHRPHHPASASTAWRSASPALRSTRTTRRNDRHPAPARCGRPRQTFVSPDSTQFSGRLHPGSEHGALRSTSRAST